MFFSVFRGVGACGVSKVIYKLCFPTWASPAGFNNINNNNTEKFNNEEAETSAYEKPKHNEKNASAHKAQRTYRVPLDLYY